MRAYIIKFKGKTIPINIFTNLKLKVNDDGGGMVSCRLRATFLSNYTKLQAGGNA